MAGGLNDSGAGKGRVTYAIVGTCRTAEVTSELGRYQGCNSLVPSLLCSLIPLALAVIRVGCLAVRQARLLQRGQLVLDGEGVRMTLAPHVTRAAHGLVGVAKRLKKHKQLAGRRLLRDTSSSWSSFQ